MPGFYIDLDRRVLVLPSCRGFHFTKINLSEVLKNKMKKIIISAENIEVFENDTYIGEIHFGSLFHTVNQNLLDLNSGNTYRECLWGFAIKYFSEVLCSFIKNDGEDKEYDFIRILDYCYLAYIEYCEYGKMKCQAAHELFETLSTQFEYITFEVESELEDEYEHLGQTINW